MTKKDVLKMIREIQNLDNEKNKTKLLNLFEKFSDTDIQVLIIKKLSTIEGNELVSFFNNIVNKPGKYSEKVRKEATSAIGRRRDFFIAQKYLIKYLEDNNPEIVLQAIRGLLVFKKNTEIKNILKDIYRSHENEIIKYVISNEFKLEKLDFDTKQSHVKVEEKYKNKVIKGDVLDILNLVENNSIHLTFTSPPYYNARDYSTYSSYKEYLSFLDSVFREVHRVTKDGRFLIVNTSPVIVSRVGRKYSSKRYPIPYDLHGVLVKQGWEFIDDIIWVKPDASVKNRIGGFMQHKKPLMYKPNGVTEQIMVYRKKSHKLIDWNIRAYDDSVIEESLVGDDFEKNNVWEIDPVFDKTHSAVFPYKLCEKIVQYYSFRGDLIFDPFAGSGTLAKASLDYGRNIFMTEISDEYFMRIQEKLQQYFEIDYFDYEEFKSYIGGN